jgi:NTE family protein
MVQTADEVDVNPENLTALILGGGGPVGASWESALLHGLTSAGIPVAEAGVILGTSAGAVVGSWLTMQPDGLPAVPELMRARATWHAANAGKHDSALFQRALGRSANGESSSGIRVAAPAAVPPISAEEADAMWRDYLPEGPWSASLAITSVNRSTGRVRVWSAEDDLPLPVAVACSTAAPGIAPPVAVADSVWVDGGVRSSVNADLLLETRVGPRQDDRVRHAKSGRVLMLVTLMGPNVAREEAILAEHGYIVRVVTADPFYTTRSDLVDARYIDIAADTGVRQAHDLAADLATWWGD